MSARRSPTSIASSVLHPSAPTRTPVAGRRKARPNDTRPRQPGVRYRAGTALQRAITVESIVGIAAILTARHTAAAQIPIAQRRS
jgi:hypothetical protein